LVVVVAGEALAGGRGGGQQQEEPDARGGCCGRAAAGRANARSGVAWHEMAAFRVRGADPAWPATGGALRGDAQGRVVMREWLGIGNTILSPRVASRSLCSGSPLASRLSMIRVPLGDPSGGGDPLPVPEDGLDAGDG